MPGKDRIIGRYKRFRFQIIRSGKRNRSCGSKTESRLFFIDTAKTQNFAGLVCTSGDQLQILIQSQIFCSSLCKSCLLYTSDAADEL